MKTILFIPLTLSLCSLVSCDSVKVAPPGLTNAEKMSKLESDLKGLRADLEVMQNRISTLETELETFNDFIVETDNGAVTIGGEGEGYAVGQTRLGSFVVFNKGVTPNLDGYKLRISVVNLTSIQLGGAKLTIKWGKTHERSKSVSVTNTFYPGKQTIVDIILSPAKPDDVKHPDIVFEFNQIGFN